MDKNKILIIIIFLLFAASGAMLFKVYNPSAFQFSLTKTSEVSDQDIVIRDKINKIDAQIQNAMSRIKDQGSLDRIISSKQYLDLDDSVIREIVIPENRGRQNPFQPIDYSKSE